MAGMVSDVTEDGAKKRILHGSVVRVYKSGLKGLQGRGEVVEISIL
jgi:hypothetical protein